MLPNALPGYAFNNPDLLKQALTHRSAGKHNNERLEFIGDGILNFIIADALYRQFESASEGDLSRLRARLVRGTTLANVARDMSLGPHLIMGSGEMKSGGERRSSILADAFEAIVGAIYLDGGFEVCRTYVLAHFHERLHTLPPAEELKDAKTRLQEYLQSRQHPLPEYLLIASSGEDHNKQFTVSCQIHELSITTEAIASSRRKAEQSAAMVALQQILGESE